MKSRLVYFVVFLLVGVAILGPLASPHGVPSWLRYTAIGLLSVGGLMAAILLLAGLGVVILGVFGHHNDRQFIPAEYNGRDESTAVQVLGREYGIVARIHGATAAAQMTAGQVAAECQRYDRAETAASEDRCQDCDPQPTPAARVVEVWDEEHHIGKYVLCTPCAHRKIEESHDAGVHADWWPLGGDTR